MGAWISSRLLYTFGDEMEYQFLQPPLLYCFWANIPNPIRLNIIKKPPKADSLSLITQILLDCLHAFFTGRWFSDNGGKAHVVSYGCGHFSHHGRTSCS